MPKPAEFSVPRDRLEEGFTDKAPLLSSTEAVYEASRCLYCHDAPCIPSCPTSIDIPTFIRKIGTGNLRGAARTILEANLLGASCARVCPARGAGCVTRDGVGGRSGRHGVGVWSLRRGGPQASR